MITYLRMSSAWHKGDGPARVPRSLAGDGEVGAGGQGLLDVPGHAFGPVPPPSINTMMAARCALSIRPAPNRHFCVAGNVRPHVNQVSA